MQRRGSGYTGERTLKIEQEGKRRNHPNMAGLTEEEADDPLPLKGAAKRKKEEEEIIFIWSNLFSCCLQE